MIRDIAIAAFVYDFSDLIAEEYREETRRRNSDQKAWLRRRDKNRGAKPVKYGRRFGDSRPSDYIGLSKLLRYTTGTLFRLVEAIPQVERDQLEIYPADFRGPQSTRKHRPPKRCWPGGISEYADPAKLSLKSGDYESVWRQRAASPGCHILVTPQLAAFYLSLLRRLPTPEEQRWLKRSGRLYGQNCYWRHWPSKKEGTLFDRCEASSSAAKSYTFSERTEARDNMIRNLDNSFVVSDDTAEVA